MLTKLFDIRSLATAGLLAVVTAAWTGYKEFESMKATIARQAETIQRQTEQLDWVLFQVTLLRQNDGLPFLPFGRIE